MDTVHRPPVSGEPPGADTPYFIRARNLRRAVAEAEVFYGGGLPPDPAA